MSFPISAVSLPAEQAFFLLPVEPKPPVPGGAGLSSASSRGAEAARAPLGLIQLRRLLHRQGAHRHNHELGYPFSRLDLIGLGSQVAQAHTDFSPDTRQAEKWLTLSAEQGNQFAQYSLGKLYYYGRGIVAPDPGKAYLWLSRSAEQGNFFAKVLLEKEAYQYQTVKRKVTHNIGYLISKLSRYLNNEQEKKRSIMLYEQMEQQLQAELEQ